jgi:hypothetical protein
MELPLRVSFRGMRRSRRVDELVRRCADRLASAYDRIQRCDVVVEAPHHRHRRGNQIRVRIAMSVPRGRLVVSRAPAADGAHEDVLVAVRDSFDAARRQLEDHVRRSLRGEVKAREVAGAAR